MKTILLLVAVTTGAFAQSAPVALETKHLVGSALAAGIPPTETQDEFFNLGFSSAGLFAYLVRHRDPGSSYELIVQDLVADKLVETKTFEGGELSVTPWWARNRDHVQDVLSRWSIERNDYQLGLFPAIVGDDYYTFTMKRTRNALVGNVRSSQKGTKTVFRKTGPFRWAGFLGFIPSPFENRVALIVLVQPYGWNGERQSLRYLVFGSSLLVGFSRP